MGRRVGNITGWIRKPLAEDTGASILGQWVKANREKGRAWAKKRKIRPVLADYMLRGCEVSTRLKLTTKLFKILVDIVPPN